MTDSDRLRIEPEDRYLVAALSKIGQKYGRWDSGCPHSSGASKNTFVICHLLCLLGYALEKNRIGHRRQSGDRI
jgi:hypothetical protein